MQGPSSVLIEMLRGDLAWIAKRCREVIADRVPAYSGVDPETFETELAMQFEYIFSSIRDGAEEGGDVQSTELVLIAAARFRQGLLLDEVFRAWWLGIDTLISHAESLNSRLGLGDATVVQLIRSILTYSHIAMAAIAAAYREAEFACGSVTDQSRERFVLDVLSGVVPPDELATLAVSYGLDPAGRYVAVRGRLSSSTPPRKLAWALGFREGQPRTRGLSAVADGCVIGFLEQPPPEDILGFAGFGPARPLDGLAASYELATRALATAEEFGLQGAFDIASVALRAAVSADVEIGEVLRERYLEPLVNAGSTNELITTLRAYLDCGMQVERTAAFLFVHQNTVRYRLSRFEELTGHSLRDTRVLFGLWWALQADRHVCRERSKRVPRFGDHDEPVASSDLKQRRPPMLGGTTTRAGEQ